MLKVAIVGCGKIADAHASRRFRRIKPGARSSACATREPLMASQLSPDRFPDSARTSATCERAHRGSPKPDVVHITTPPPEPLQHRAASASSVDATSMWRSPLTRAATRGSKR